MEHSSTTNNKNRIAAIKRLHSKVRKVNGITTSVLLVDPPYIQKDINFQLTELWYYEKV